MEKLSITLTSAQKAYIDAEVAAGRYASTSEVLRDSIRQTMSAAYLEDRISRALVQADAKDFVDESEILAKLDHQFSDDLRQANIAE